MAERASAGQTLTIRLSYRDLPDGTKPLGARVFDYTDVQKFLKAVREAYYRHYNERGKVRYLIGGEQGSRRGRVHYHCILYTDKPLHVLGKITDFVTKEPIDKFVYDRNLEWSLWPHGHVHIEEPAQEGIRYAIYYALMDQFNVETAKKKSTYIKSQNHSSTKLGQSLKPPLGFKFVQELMDRCEAEQRVPIDLMLSVPDLKGTWWPQGPTRDYLLERCFLINEKHNKDHGRDCPQWRSLTQFINSQKSERDKEILHYGKPLSKETKEEKDARFDAYHKATTTQRSKDNEYRKIIHNCGHVIPCQTCLDRSTKSVQRFFDAEYKRRFDRWTTVFKKKIRYNASRKEWEVETDYDYEARFKKWWLARPRPSSGCLNRDDPYIQSAFDARSRLEKAGRRTAKIKGPSEPEVQA